MRISFIVLFVITLVSGQAQNSVGAYTNVNFQFFSLSNTPTGISDSLKGIKKSDRVFSFGTEFRKQIDRYQAVSFNPGFYQMSSLFVLRDLQLFDVIHPTLPEIRDQAQAASKVANMHYRFKYISAQVQYSRRIKSSYRANAISLEYTGALSYLFLVNQDIRLQTEGFALQGDFVHIIKDSIFFEGRKHNLVFSTGLDVVYPTSPDVMVFGGAVLHLPLLTTSTNNPTIRHLSPGIKVGLRYLL